MHKYLSSLGAQCLLVALIFCFPFLSKGQISPPEFKDKVVIKENYKIPGEFFPVRGSILIIKGNAYVGGDIFVGDSAYIERFQFMQASSVSNREASIWPGGIIPYEIELWILLVYSSAVIAFRRSVRIATPKRTHFLRQV